MTIVIRSTPIDTEVVVWAATMIVVIRSASIDAEVVVRGVSIPLLVVSRDVWQPIGTGTGSAPTLTYLHRAWSPDNAAVVFWTDTAINLSPSVTIPVSVVGNLVNKCVMM